MVSEEGEVEALRCDVRVASSLRIVKTFVLAVQSLDIGRDNFVLVGWAGKVVTESTAGSIEVVSIAVKTNAWLTECGDFGLELLRSANRCDVWARCGEFREESAVLQSLLRQTDASSPPRPSSPDEHRRVVPRAPICANS